MSRQPGPPITNRVPPPERVAPQTRQSGGQDAGDRRRDRRRGPRKAVALEYRHGKQRVPVVIASGRGQLAEQIIALARKYGVYVQEDPDLVELLARLDLGMVIPPQLYYVVAEILAFVYKLNSAQATANDPNPEAKKAL